MQGEDKVFQAPVNVSAVTTVAIIPGNWTELPLCQPAHARSH